MTKVSEDQETSANVASIVIPERTIVWDVDDVLNNLMQSWLELDFLPKHPDRAVNMSDLISNPPHQVLGITREYFERELDVYRTSTLGKSLRPVPEAISWFHRHGYRFRHVALTSRPFVAVPPAADWVFTHFGRWIRTFGFVPSPRADDLEPFYDHHKGDWLRWMRIGDVLVDDSEANVRLAQDLGLQTVLVPRPWNNAAGGINEALARLSAILEIT